MVLNCFSVLQILYVQYMLYLQPASPLEKDYLLLKVETNIEANTMKSFENQVFIKEHNLY